MKIWIIITTISIILISLLPQHSITITLSTIIYIINIINYKEQEEVKQEKKNKLVKI